MSVHSYVSLPEGKSCMFPTNITILGQSPEFNLMAERRSSNPSEQQKSTGSSWKHAKNVSKITLCFFHFIAMNDLSMEDQYIITSPSCLIYPSCSWGVIQVFEAHKTWKTGSLYHDFLAIFFCQTMWFRIKPSIWLNYTNSLINLKIAVALDHFGMIPRTSTIIWVKSQWGCYHSWGTPKWMVYNGKSVLSGWFQDHPRFLEASISKYPRASACVVAPNLLFRIQ